MRYIPFTCGEGVIIFPVRRARPYFRCVYLDEAASWLGGEGIGADFFRHTLLVSGVVGGFFPAGAAGFLAHSPGLAVAGLRPWHGLCIPSFSRKVFMKVTRLSSLGGVNSTSWIFFGFDSYLILIIAHFSVLGWNSNFSSLSLRWRRISPAPTSMFASAVIIFNCYYRMMSESSKN